MAFMNWSAQLEVGHNEIDSQHKKLVDLVNKLHDAMKNRTGQEALKPVLNELVSYTKYHFSTEETLMKSKGYPDFPSHKKEHDALTQQVVDLQNKINQSNTSLVTIETMNFLRDWLKNHILGTDMKLSAFLKR
jgi:hemerythrin-like metal-binding protein